MAKKPEKEVVEESKGAGIWANLPLVSVLKRKQMDQSKELLEELDSVHGILATYKERKEEIEEELAQIQMEAKLDGLRWGDWAFRRTVQAGRKTLSKEKLIENGVSADVIAKSFEQGKSFSKDEFKNLSGKIVKI